MNRRFRPDRYEAAIRLERARGKIRELNRYHFPVSKSDTAELHAAIEEYDLASGVSDG